MQESEWEETKDIITFILLTIACSIWVVVGMVEALHR